MAKSLESAEKQEDFFDVVGKTFGMYKESWEAFKLNWQVFVISYVVMLGVFVLGGIIMAATIASSINSDSTAVFTGAWLSSFLIILLLAFAVAIVIGPLVINAQLASAQGKVKSFGECAKESQPKILGFLGLCILMGIVIGFLSLLLIIPGIIAAVMLMFAPFIYIDKKIGVTDAMKESFELVKARWQWAVALVLVQIALSIASSVLNYLPIIGWAAGIVLSVVFFCLPALVYTKISKK